MFIIVWVRGNNFPDAVVGPFSCIEEAQSWLRERGYREDFYKHFNALASEVSQGCYARVYESRRTPADPWGTTAFIRELKDPKSESTQT